MARSAPRSPRKSHPGCGLLVLLLFMGVGAGIGWTTSIQPILDWFASRSWTAVPCVIEKAELISDSDGEGGTTYGIAVRFRYTWEGAERTSERHALFDVKSNLGVEGKRQEVRALQGPEGAAGTVATCWVDPKHPDVAVIDRSFRGDYLFGLLFLGIFCGIPLLVAVGWWRGRRAERRRAALDLEPAHSAAATVTAQAPMQTLSQGPVRLMPSERPFVGLIVLLLFGGFWNGMIYGLFLPSMLHAPDGVSFFLLLFLLPFAVVGLCLAGAVVYKLLACFNPRPVLELERGGLRVGERCTLRWSWLGNHRRMTRLTLALIGREAATYTRGTDTVTDRRDFVRSVLLEELDIQGEGTTELRIPADGPPSFVARSNSIQWYLEVHGDIGFYPDARSEYALEVLPACRVGLPLTGDGPTSGPLVLSGGRTAYAPGDQVRGRVEWPVAEAARILELRLFWATEGKGTSDVGIAERLRVEASASAGHQEFSLSVPAGPVSIHGRLVSVRWALELVDEAGDRLGNIDLVVGSDGRTVELPAEDAAKR